MVAQITDFNYSGGVQRTLWHILGFCFAFVNIRNISVSFGVIAAAILWRYVVTVLLSPYRRLERPPLKGWRSPIMGNLIEMQDDEPGHKQMKWTKRYGGAVVYRGAFGTSRLLLSDPLALSHVLTNAYDFPKPAGLRSALSSILGDGVLTTEGQQHKYQRKLVNPTFNQASVRSFTPHFHSHARKLVASLREMYENKDDDELAPAMDSKRFDIKTRRLGTVVDALHWTSRTTLDVIGDTAFSHDLGALKNGDKGSKIAESFQALMTRVGQLSLSERLLLHIEQFSIFNGLRPFPTSFNRAAQKTQQDVADVAKVMIDEHKNGHDVTDSNLLQKILTLNNNANLPAAQRMTDKEVVGQLTTLILAGHETTSTALTWALWALAHHPEHQTRLRKEIRDLWVEGNDDITFEELNGSFDFLDRVTLETLRLHPPVHSTIREGSCKAFIPLSKPVRNVDGTLVDRIRVDKGTPLIVSIVTYNRRLDIWGNDALEFNPDRWLDLPDTVTKNGIPGGHLAFIAGPRNCVGSKFALTEFKIILAHIIRTFHFAPLPGDLASITSKQVVVTRSRIHGLEKEGTQMPLIFSTVPE